MTERIEINKELIPYTFDILLGGEMFTIRIDYNSTGDLFTATLYKNGQLICGAEPIIYGSKLWGTVYVSGEFPMVDIIPLDISGETTAVTHSNLNETVFLWIDNQGDDET